MPDKKCPRCGLWNIDSALRCDCGYDFKKGTVEEPYYKNMDRSNPQLIKVRDFAIGFFGWVILNNIYFVLLLFLQQFVLLYLLQQSFQESLSIIFENTIIIWLPTLTAILVLFVMKKLWVGIGTVSVVIINSGILLIIYGGVHGFTTEMINIMGFPFPFNFIFFNFL